MRDKRMVLRDDIVKILVLDDIRFNLMVCERKLRALGHTVYKASTAEQALKQLEKDPEIELVLADYVLDNIDGLTFRKNCHKALRIQLGRDLPAFVLVTAYKEDSLSEKAKKWGFMDVLKKPLAKETLADLVERTKKGEHQAFNRTERILIYAKDQNIQHVIEKSFPLSAFEVVTVNEPYRALAYFNNNHGIAAIFVEEQFCLIDGLNFYDLCVKNQQYNDEGPIPPPPCFAVLNADKTPEEQTEYIKTAYQNGIKHVFYQPLSVSKVKEVLIDLGIGMERYGEGFKENRDKILLVEDVTFLRVLITKRLTNAGFNIMTAATGEEALQLFREEGEIKAVITDFELPDLNGGEVYQRCKDMRRYNQQGDIPCPPFILISAYANFEHIEEVMNGEFHTVFRKPLSDTQLLDALEEIMQRKKKKPKLLNLALNPRQVAS